MMMQHSYQRYCCSSSLLCLTSPAVRHEVSTLRIYRLPMRCVGLRFFSVRLVIFKIGEYKNSPKLCCDQLRGVKYIVTY
nr:MAG TPA: hypothetical protein [Caudoviricetes sp.]